MHVARSLLFAASLSLAAAPALAQGGPDELWNMNTRMEMAGMPGQTFPSQVCMKKGEAQPQKMSQDKNCKVTDVRTVGNKTSWKVVCSGRDAMSGTGEITRTRDSMDGRIRLQGKSGGDTMDMTMVLSGKLAGSCNAGETQKKQQAQAKAMVAQGEAQMAQMCKESMEKYITQMFEGEGAACKAQKPEFCAHAGRTTQAMRTAAGYRKSAKAADWEQVGKACKISMAPVRAAACKDAVGVRDWPFVADYCPAESKKIAAEQCAGRGYTAAMASEYQAICSRHASRAAEEQKPAAAPTASGAVKEGASQLRKLFGR
jgi:uncharacterized protein DUF3617